MSHTVDHFEPGQRITVVQQIPQRNEVWTTRTTGTVMQFEQRKTGSWYAHAKDDKLWLDRLTVRKDDGEIVVFNLDRYTHVEVHEQSATQSATSAESSQPQTDEAESDDAEDAEPQETAA